MAVEQKLEIDGEVTEALPNLLFRVKLENDHELLAHLAGKMRRFRIRVLPGDKVRVEVSPYDLNRGRIVYRYYPLGRQGPSPCSGFTFATSRLRSRTASRTAPTATRIAADVKATWKPSTSRAALSCGRRRVAEALRCTLVVRSAASVDRIARPSAPPTCCDVLNRPEARPASSRLDVGRGDQRDRHERVAHAERTSAAGPGSRSLT